MNKPPERPNRPSFVPYRLKQARLAAGLTAAALAEKIGVERSLIALYESGRAPSAENWGPLAHALGVQRSYFSLPIDINRESLDSAINFRALKKSPVTERLRARALLEWVALTVGTIENLVGFPPAKLPTIDQIDIDALSEDAIDSIALDCRKFFGLGTGPISNLTLLLENHGVVVAIAPLDGDMDGLSAVFCGRPIILIKSGVNYFRSRFDIAHELGHLILHRDLSQEEIDSSPGLLDKVEKQAHRFASALLLPEPGFLPETLHTDFDSLLSLKKRWGVSVAAMVRRLYDLDVISDSTYRRFQTSISQRKWRKHEPMDETPAETPRLLKRAAEFAAAEGIAPFHEAFSSTTLPMRFIAMIAGLSDEDLVPKSADATNILAFAKKPTSL